MANETAKYATDWAFSATGGVSAQGIAIAGNDSTLLICTGAFRFEDVIVPQGSTVNAGEFKFYVKAKGTGSSGTLRLKVYGIDEDDTADFSSSPFGRTKTSASVTYSGVMPGTGNYVNFGISSIVNEIVQRAGWSSGNALGLIVEDDGSDVNYWIEDDSDSILSVRVNAEPDFTPTPVTVSAPTFPSSTDYGIRISQPSIDVKTATEPELYFTTRKKELRINEEKIIGTATSFAHGLSYAPCVLGYNIDGSANINIMNFPSNLVSVEPYIASDGTVVKLYPDQGAYVYVFIDPLS